LKPENRRPFSLSRHSGGTGKFQHCSIDPLERNARGAKKGEIAGLAQPALKPDHLTVGDDDNDDINKMTSF
jgi:hypothetical protein